MAYAVSAAFLAALRLSRVATARIVTLTPDLHELDVYEADDALLIEGSVTCDRTRDQRRTCSVRLANPAGAYTPLALEAPFGLLRPYRLDRGLVLPTGLTEWCPLGVFVVLDPEASASAAGAGPLVLAGTDRSRILADSRFGAPYTAAAGRRVADVVREIAQDAGMGADDELYALDDDGAYLGAPITWEEEASRLSAVLALCTANALECAPDPEGVLVLRPIPDPTAATVAWEFDPGEAEVMTDVTIRRSAAGLANRVVVVGESAAAGPYRGEARDLDPTSPVYNPADGSGPVGDRPAPIIRLATITSRAQAQAVAVARLRDVATVEEEVSVSMAPLPHLEAGDVVTIDEPNTRAGGRYVIDALSIPVGPGAMTLTTKRVRSLTA